MRRSTSITYFYVYFYNVFISCYSTCVELSVVKAVMLEILALVSGTCFSPTPDPPLWLISSPRGSLHLNAYFSLLSLNTTCFLTTGSYFFRESLCVTDLGFLRVT